MRPKKWRNGASRVVIERVRSFDEHGIKDASFHAIDSTGFQCNQEINLVLIKPNLCYYWDYTTGETTDPRVVSAVIDYLRERINPQVDIKIIESDASAMRADNAFLILGYRRLAEQKKVELLNLSKEETIEKEAVINRRKIKLAFAKTLFEADLLVNVPKLKVGPFADGHGPHITCALKNFFGLISTPRKFVYHGNLSEVIVAVNKIVKPNLVVVDGVIAKGKRPKKLGIILGGTDNFSVDVLASKIMGYKPTSVKHVKLAGDEGLGQIPSLVLGSNDLSYLKSQFPRLNRRIFNLTWKTELFAVHAYAKLIGDVIPPVLD